MALPALAPGASALAQAVLGWGVPPEPGVTHGRGQGPPEYSAPPGEGSRAGTRAMRPPRVPLSTGHEPSTLSRPGHPIPGHTPLWGHPTLPAALPQLCWQPGGDSSSVSPSMPRLPSARNSSILANPGLPRLRLSLCPRPPARHRAPLPQGLGCARGAGHPCASGKEPSPEPRRAGTGWDGHSTPQPRAGPYLVRVERLAAGRGAAGVQGPAGWHRGARGRARRLLST